MAQKTEVKERTHVYRVDSLSDLERLTGKPIGAITERGIFEGKINGKAVFLTRDTEGVIFVTTGSYDKLGFRGDGTVDFSDDSCKIESYSKNKGYNAHDQYIWSVLDKRLKEVGL